MKSNFWSEPHVDWNTQNIALMRESLKKILGKHCPVMIDGQIRKNSNYIISSLDPSQTSRIVGTSGATDTQDINAAASVAMRAWQSWRHSKIETRANILGKAGEIFRERKFDLAACMIYEVGKSWDEAIGEVEEAIDFIELYREAILNLAEPIFHQPWIKAEKNYSRFIPRGITAAIATWNFPVALSVEPIVASLLAGSPVLYKPAEQSPVCGWEVVRCFLDAGVPAGLLAYLPGDAETGKALVACRSVTQIAFTGSREAGMHIYESTARNPSDYGPKRVLMELGGNNSMIICESATHDKVVKDIIASTFGFMGQKCSASHRLIIIGKRLRARWFERLCEAVLSLQIGHPQYQQYRYSALIDKFSQDKFLAKIKLLKEIGNLEVEHGEEHGDGYYVKPAIFSGVPQAHALVQEEAFSPLLFVFQAKDIEEAVNIANDTSFALTSGIHTESESEIQYFLENIECGNAYINRPITGSHPGRQPFGGYKFSGFGNKIGTPKRLEAFMNAQTISVNLERHGTIL